MFRAVIGHRRLVDLVARAIQRTTLPPSLIFAGPEGVGKRLVAVSAAQALNCPGFGGAGSAGSDALPAHALPDACGTCASCRRIARGVHPDVLIVEPGDSGSIKIEQIRDVVDRAAYRPFEGRRRVVIVDRADALVPQAQNALLKTLEEPPSASIFILVTSRPDMLLPTVLSRCPRLRFRPLAEADVAAALIKQGRNEAEARATAAMADGSIGRALAASGTALVAARTAALRTLAHAAANADARGRIEGARELLAKSGAGATEREQLAANLRAMASLLRDVEFLSAFAPATADKSALAGATADKSALAGAKADKSVLAGATADRSAFAEGPAARRRLGEGGVTRADSRALANPDVQPALDRLTPFFRGERGVRAFTTVDQALVALDRNAGVKLVADWVLLQL